jgi:hypothetical protein
MTLREAAGELEAGAEKLQKRQFIQLKSETTSQILGAIVDRTSPVPGTT